MGLLLSRSPSFDRPIAANALISHYNRLNYQNYEGFVFVMNAHSTISSVEIFFETEIFTKTQVARHETSKDARD